MKNFIISNWITLLIATIFLCYVLFLIINKKWDKLRELGNDFIREAEKDFIGTKRGKEKFNCVYDQIYNLIPAKIRIFIPKSYLKAKLQKWYENIKNDLKTDKITTTN